MKKSEIWHDIKGYPGYQVSNMGRIRSSKTNNYQLDADGYHIIKTHVRGAYKSVTFYQDGKLKSFLVHRLVATEFNPNPFGYKYVNHIDENKLNNQSSNLEWCSALQNLKHSNVIDKMLNGSHKANEKRVLMFKDGILISEFDSITKAAEYIGSYQQLVTNCLYGKQKTTRGYSFKFKN